MSFHGGIADECSYSCNLVLVSPLPVWRSYRQLGWQINSDPLSELTDITDMTACHDWPSCLRLLPCTQYKWVSWSGSMFVEQCFARRFKCYQHGWLVVFNERVVQWRHVDECIWYQAMSFMLTSCDWISGAVTDKRVFIWSRSILRAPKICIVKKIVIRIKLKADAQKGNLRFHLTFVRC